MNRHDAAGQPYGAWPCQPTDMTLDQQIRELLNRPPNLNDCEDYTDAIRAVLDIQPLTSTAGPSDTWRHGYNRALRDIRDTCARELGITPPPGPPPPKPTELPPHVQAAIARGLGITLDDPTPQSTPNRAAESHSGGTKQAPCTATVHNHDLHQGQTTGSHIAWQTEDNARANLAIWTRP